jgi:hypothetical protein
MPEHELERVALRHTAVTVDDDLDVALRSQGRSIAMLSERIPTG